VGDSWDSVREIQREISDWANLVFPDRTAHDALCKLMLEEIPEFALAQKDPGEYADLVILVLDIATLNGIDVAAAVRDKMEVNRARRWIVGDNGLMKHTKD
jgi:NTP pyrophosphatase (non-canonical NTP hydrolase)